MGMGVFGPLTLEGASLSPRERMVLATLVLRAGRTVTTDELAEAVWGEAPPGTWPKQLQASVGRVRSAIGRNAIETTPDGYVLRIDPDRVDVERFERLASAAGRHLADDDPARALDSADRALALWRGTPYADLASWAPAVVEAERLDEVRMGLEEQRLEARLRLGQHAASVADAERLVRESPLRERRWVMLATALYRSGRQADALAAIRAARDRLADELGAEPGAELRELELAVLRHDESLEVVEASEAASTVCPYRGLRPFGVDDEEDFFGRGTDIATALGRLARSRFLAVSGASGSGKSSLVLAGLVPALQRRGDRVTILTPGQHLDLSVRDALGGRDPADVIVIDQFEEAFHAGEADVDSAAQAIADAVASGKTVVLVVRSDFLDHCAAHPLLAPLVTEGIHLVGPMSPDALRAAIEQPARRAGLRLEPGLVEVILRDAVGEPGALPHMSHALVETWLRREGATLTVEGYAASGGISGAIAQSADQLYQSMDGEQRALCRSLLMRLVALGPDGSPVRRRVSAGPLRTDAARERVLSMLAGARLVSTEAESVAVAHESLATAWPRLHAWLEEGAEAARVLAAVATAAETWSADGRPDDALLRGARLHSAIEWRDATAPDLTALERDFLAASVDRDRNERRLEAERARRDRQQNLRLRAALVAAGALLLVSVIAAGFVFVKSDEAARSAEDRRIEALASTSLALRESDPGVAALLAAEMHRRWPGDSRSYSALWGAVAVGEGLVSRILYEHGDRLVAAPIPGGRTALLVRDVPGEDDGLRTVVSLADLDQGREVRTLDVEIAPATTWYPRGLRVSGDGRIAALQTNALRGGSGDDSACCVNSFDFIDLATGRSLVETVVLDSRTGNAFSINHDGSRVAVVHPITGDLIMIDTATGGLLTPLPGPPEEFVGVEGRYTTASFAADGSILVGGPGGIAVHDGTTFERQRLIPLPDGMTEWAISETEDGSLLVTGMDAMGLVEPDSGELRWTRQVEQATCVDVLPPPGSATFLCRDVSGAVQEHDLATGEPTDRRFPNLSDWTSSFALIDDDEFVTVAEREGAFVAHWRLDGAPAVTVPVADGRTVVDGFGGGGRYVITAPQGWRPEEGGDVRIWDVETDRPVSPPFDGLNWADDRHVFAWSPDADPIVLDVVSGTTADLPELSEDGVVNTVSGGSGPLAFVLDGEDVTPIDPTTGRSAGETMTVPGVQLAQYGASVAELGDGQHAAVNWFDPNEVRMMTAVFDLSTGEELVRGLPDYGPVIATGREHLLSASSSRLTRSDAELNPLEGLPTSAVSARSLQLSGDGRMLLLDDWDNRLSLYDMEDRRRLGTPLAMVAQDGQEFPASFLSADGTTLATNWAGGVLIWDIRPERLAEAACRSVGRELTRLEWEAYFGSEEQVATCDAWLSGGPSDAAMAD